ncbi:MULTISPECIES: hypothetical protein [Bacillus]|uniref:hypothetical protein n=1 Tax=Bacillus TaxID=1386 RepID=UPI000402DE47|nr:MULTISPECIES: hypothetical protein [Bacillus]QHZ47230.1 hypothetical protein M654_013465 [Bacillus sp. NSP9.1]WFA03290.1 hypothetical protein P3X63_11280 [Bacillus sp. HSf4]
MNKNRIVNHLLGTLNQEMDAKWWTKYLEMLMELVEERTKQQEGSLDSEDELNLDDIDDSMKPLLTDLTSILENMNNSILESNHKVLKDIQRAVASGNMDREDLEEIIASLPSDTTVSNSESKENMKGMRDDVLNKLKESLPEEHTLANTETVKILQAAQSNEESENN